MQPFQYVVSVLIMIAALLTIVYVFYTSLVPVVLWALAFGIVLLVLFSKKMKPKYFWASVVSIMLANVFITHHFYYHLLQYQLGSKIGRYYKQQIPLSERTISEYKLVHPLNSMHFYADRLIDEDTSGLLKYKYVLTSPEGLDSIRTQRRPYDMLQQGDYFKVSELTPEFLNPATRDKAVMKYYLLKLK